MQDARSSKPSSVRLGNLHIVVSSIAAIAGVAIAGYQAFAPSTGQPPLSVVVSVDPAANAAVPGQDVEKSDVSPVLPTESLDLSRGASFTAALKDDSAGRYSFGTLFDGESDTFVAIAAPDTELNIMVNFKDGASHPVTAIEYIPPAGVDPARMAMTIDVMVLPEGQLEASGRPVISFDLPQSNETHTYAIPGRAEGKAVWLRVAGKPGIDKTFVGDFRILSEGVAP